MPSCCAKDPVDQLNTLHKMASVLQHEHESVASDNDEEIPPAELSHASPQDEVVAAPRSAASLASVDSEEPMNNQTAENKRLVKMGMTTAVAIGLHNFPEGLATFVATLNDPKVGVVLGVAIAIHNIPEGLCVALPLYYASGNRWHAFLWALLSGASEIVAALLGWAILANTVSDTVYAALFGLVAGMMVVISIRELLPTAHFYDPDDTVVTNSFIGGMVVIALSLVLFQL
jgi:zinc transporter, ZIP family